MEETNIQLLAQLLEAMEEAISKMEEYYNKKDIENFNKYKAAVLEFQLKINHLLGENGA